MSPSPRSGSIPPTNRPTTTIAAKKQLATTTTTATTKATLMIVVMSNLVVASLSRRTGGGAAAVVSAFAPPSSSSSYSSSSSSYSSASRQRWRGERPRESSRATTTARRTAPVPSIGLLRSLGHGHGGGSRDDRRGRDYFGGGGTSSLYFEFSSSSSPENAGDGGRGAAADVGESSSSSSSSSSSLSSSSSSSRNRTSTSTSTTVAPPLLLDPRAPLRPLLSSSSSPDDDHFLSGYSLPPTVIGRDDYRPNLKRKQRVVAFGDVHGDISALREFLVAAEVLDPDSTNDEPMWSGGETICVQTGDVLDRGDDELACFRLLATLGRQAKKAGGALLLLYGNHESLNAAGLFQYADPGGNAEFERTVGRRIDYNFGSNRWRLQFAGNEPSRWAAMEPGGLLSEDLLGNMMVACVLGRTAFVHAGLTAEHLRGGNKGGGEGGGGEYGGISRLNEQAREWILTAHHGDNNNWGEYDTVEEVISAAQNRAKVASRTMPDCLGGGVGASSPVWMRDYSQPNDKEPKNPRARAMIAEALKEAGPDVQRMVMGHTPQRRINSALGGRAWRIDVGASKGVMGGTPEVLEIIHMGGDDDEDVINILTVDGDRVSGKERSVSNDGSAIMDFFDMRR